MGGIRGVGFDLDGTLYANYKLNIRLIPLVFREWPLLLAFFRVRKGLHKQAAGTKTDYYTNQAALMAEQLKKDPLFIQEKLDRLVYRGWEEQFAHIQAFPHVRETLSAFKTAGLALGLLSDISPKRKLELLGLDGFFNAILSTEEQGALKPDPEPFKKLALDMKLLPEEVLYVGNNSRYDILGAKNAGMKTALIRRGFFSTGFSGKAGAKHADFVFKSYRQLQKYVLG
jgi:putative hydrolase of the HAD superfamily